MLIPSGAVLHIAKVPLRDLFLYSEQGIDLRLAHEYATTLRKAGARGMDYFGPLGCARDGDRYGVLEGRHRYLAYLSLAYKHCWVFYYETPAS